MDKYGLCEVITSFTNKHGKPLVMYPNIKKLGSDTFGFLAEEINTYLNYSNYRFIWSILLKFTNNGDLYDDNNLGLSEFIIDELKLN